ncbi:MAG: hypothetical protein COT33_01240 [Candidatus Nealsonbacteria bacterium CG08_land_8_20_14_0_20_38_20]|uniref:Methyltransferase domain-containing protein n=1 Tax=Candidatus Nealsonbacteria bacterium CG08_land_8_20_14_0_20_38_20 TaxID=1974705 RepID=A0A2H0YM48_9BACT|nr:MAG: hypothetical protein COT33_01240 [Candidatus Nealsonbacteria bacterium CG08_land_8_20_14_0_20_38_20]
MPTKGEPKFELRASVKAEKQNIREKLEIEDEEYLSIFNKNRKYFEEFLRKTDQKENSNKFLIEKCPVKEKQKILAVGAGSGEDVLGFLEFLKSKDKSFEFYYLDPSKLSFKEFIKNVKKFKLTEHVSGVDFNKFESFETKKKFDTIIASHVFYYIKD